MTAAGNIYICLTHDAGQVRELAIQSTRPRGLTQLFNNKTPEHLLTLLPLLFTLCANAQAFSALLVCRSALDLSDEAEADKARECLVRLETLREHFWRIIVDWPVLLDHQADKTELARFLALEREAKAALFKNGEAFKLSSCFLGYSNRWHDLVADVIALLARVLFEGDWLHFAELSHAEQLAAWVHQHSCLPAQLLKTLHANDWLTVGHHEHAHLPIHALDQLHGQLQHADLQAFCQQPSWYQTPVETTPLSRLQQQPLVAALTQRYGHGLLTRFCAVLLDIVDCLKRLQQPDLSVSCYKTGAVRFAEVPAARGLLIHRLELQDGLVYDYQIIAPTEWNFHPNGVLAASLRNLSAANATELKQQVHWLVHAIDPCVAYSLILKP